MRLHTRSADGKKSNGALLAEINAFTSYAEFNGTLNAMGKGLSYGGAEKRPAKTPR
jgi:hypothetical protein